MKERGLLTDEEKLREAAMHMELALQLLDATDVSADIGAHLDLAICRLQERLLASEAPVSQIRSQED